MFDRKFGKTRRGDQAPHDRYSLEYAEGMEVPEPWQDLIGELRSDVYRNTIARLFEAKDPEFIIVVNPSGLFWKVRDRLKGKDIQRL